MNEKKFGKFWSKYLGELTITNLWYVDELLFDL